MDAVTSAPSTVDSGVRTWELDSFRSLCRPAAAEQQQQQQHCSYNLRPQNNIEITSPALSAIVEGLPTTFLFLLLLPRFPSSRLVSRSRSPLISSHPSARLVSFVHWIQAPPAISASWGEGEDTDPSLDKHPVNKANSRSIRSEYICAGKTEQINTRGYTYGIRWRYVRLTSHRLLST